MIYFLGDVHGHFDHIHNFLARRGTKTGEPCSLIFLGDIESPRSFEEVIRPFIDLGADVWFIHGNHDTDHNANWNNLQESQHRNLNGRVVEIEGLRIAGLGGVFRGEIWYPGMKCDEVAGLSLSEDTKRHQSYAAYSTQVKSGKHKNKDFFAAKLLKHQSSIFPDVYDALGQLKADVLVTHEAPDAHPHGFSKLGLLAGAMGVKRYFHGHHHDNRDYPDWASRTGIQAHGVGLREITDLNGQVGTPDICSIQTDA